LAKSAALNRWPRGASAEVVKISDDKSKASFGMTVGLRGDDGRGERARESDPEHNRQASDLVFQGHPLANQLLACDDQRTDGVRRQASAYKQKGQPESRARRTASARASLAIAWQASHR
jgi:hypothetical protein